MKKRILSFLVASLISGCEKKEIGTPASNDVLAWYNVLVFSGGTSICSPTCSQNYRLLITRQAHDKVSLSIYSNYVDWGFSTESISYDLQRNANAIEFYQDGDKVGEYRNDTLKLSEINYVIRNTPSEMALPIGTKGMISRVTAVKSSFN